LNCQYAVLVLKSGESGTLFAQFCDQSTQLGIVEMGAAGHAKFRRSAARLRFPAADQSSCRRLAKMNAGDIGADGSFDLDIMFVRAAK
jgi:hypothetical protein